MLVVCNNARMLLAVMWVRGTQEEVFVRSRYLLCSSFFYVIYLQQRGRHIHQKNSDSHNPPFYIAIVIMPAPGSPNAYALRSFSLIMSHSHTGSLTPS